MLEGGLIFELLCLREHLLAIVRVDVKLKGNVERLLECGGFVRESWSFDDLGVR